MPRRDPTSPPALAIRRVGQRGRLAAALAASVALSLLHADPAEAADPARGALLFASPPAPGLLGCADCHSDNPIVNNFGNIWAGRNAIALIDRAIQSNTGGMGYLRNYRSSADLADIAAYLGNSPGAVDFASTPVGARSSVRTVTVATSTKTGAGGFGASTEGDFQIVASDCGVDRPRFSTCSIELVFAPLATGQRRGTLLLSHDATPTPVRIALAGVAPDRPPAVASVSPQAIDFGTGAVGLPGGQRAVTLSNDSAEPLTVAGAATDGDFAIVGGNCTAGTVLARGERCTFALRFEARSAGVASGRLVVDHDGAGGRSVVALDGRAEPLSAARARLDVDGLDFGAWPIDVAGPRAAVSLQNIGTADWTSLDVGAPGSGFAVDTSLCRAALPLRTGQSCTLQVTFTPPRPGRFSATLRIGGAGLDAPVGLPLQGEGADPAAARWQVDRPRLVFDAAVGQSAMQELIVRHSGPAPLAWPGARLDGPQAGDFAIDPAGTTCGAVLAAGAACRVVVRFQPGALGLRRARLQWPAGGPAAAPAAIELAGRATAGATPRVAVDAVALRFGPAPVGTASPEVQRLTVRNPGTVDWRWARLRTTGDHGGDFVPTGSCTTGATLPAGASCQIDLRFAPTVPGPRAATLLLEPEGGPPAWVSLSGGGPASPLPALATVHGTGAGALVVLPGTLVFQAAPATAGQAQTQTVRWRNQGNGVLRIGAFELQAAGFGLSTTTTTTAADDRCPAPPFDLLPGQACSVVLTWSGTSAGAAGGRLSALADDPWGGAGVDIAVSEDPAQRSNVGTGGGVPGAVGWWLGLGLAVAALAMPGAAARRRRPRWSR